MTLPILFKLDGFEHGNAGSGTADVYNAFGGTPAIVTTPVRTGARALEISTTAAAEFVRYDITAGNRIVTQSFYVRVPSAPAADIQIASFSSGTSGNVWYESALDTLGLNFGSGSITNFGPTIAIDTWYRVDVEYDTSANPNVLSARVDGGTEGQISNAVVAADITACHLGTGSAHTFTAYYDDWLISVTSGDYELLNSMAFHSVARLSPSADGAHNIATAGNFDDITDAFDNTTTTSYLNIQDAPLNTTNTADNIIRQDVSDASGYMEHLYDDLVVSTDDPIDVRVYAVDVDDAAAGTNGNILRFLLPADVPATPDIRLLTDDPGLTVTMRKKVLDRPGGGWTRANVNALKSQWGLGSGTPAAHLLGVMVEVAMGPHVAVPEDSLSARRSLVA